MNATKEEMVAIHTERLKQITVTKAGYLLPSRGTPYDKAIEILCHRQIIAMCSGNQVEAKRLRLKHRHLTRRQLDFQCNPKEPVK